MMDIAPEAIRYHMEQRGLQPRDLIPRAVALLED
jgi:hypothetical protein